MKRDRIRMLVDLIEAGPPTLGSALAVVGLVDNFRAKLTRSETHRLRIAAYQEVGLVDRKRCRETGHSLSIYDSHRGFDADTSGDRYAVVCDEHATLVYVSSLSHARSVSCLHFCDWCRGIES